jgi:hypothetical protein
MELLNKPGIYLIYNLENQRVYVGQSKNVRRRLNAHRSCLLLGNHKNNYLQRAFDKYGEDKFVFRSVEYCEVENLTEREEYWIGRFNSMSTSRGYNLSRAKTHGGHSEETRAKMSMAAKGKVLSKETRAKLSEAFKGKTHSEEARAKMCISQKGRTHSEESRAKMGAAHKGNKYCLGKTHSEEVRAAISAAGKGRIVSKETRAKLSEAGKGRTHSEETRANISASAKLRWERQRTTKKA